MSKTRKKPRIKKETFDYINSLDKDITDKVIEEYSTHALEHGSEYFVNMLAACDTLSRHCKIFKSLNTIHKYYIINNKKYKKVYEEVIKEGTHLNNLIKEFDLWSKEQRSINSFDKLNRKPIIVSKK